MVHLFCERLLKKPRLEAPLSLDGSESERRRNHEVRGTADQLSLSPGGQRPSRVGRRAPRRHRHCSIGKQWRKRRAQDTRAQPRTDRWTQKPSQIRGHSHLGPGLYPSPFSVSHEPRGPIRNFLTFGYSTQMNQQRPEAGFRRPLLQDPGAGFTQPMQIPQALFDQEYRAMPQYPASPWQQPAHLPLHLSCLRQHGARPALLQHPNHTLGGWQGPSGMM